MDGDGFEPFGDKKGERRLNCPPEVGLIYSVFLPGDLYVSEIYVDS